MTEKERLREKVSGPLTPEQVRERAEEGWRIEAVEWVRDAGEGSEDAGRLKQEIPYGLRVSGDNAHLEENPEEKEALVLMLEMIVEDRSLSEVAAGLNRQGLRNRRGAEWTQSQVFDMLPRLIEVAPQIYSSAEWKDRRSVVTERMAELLG